MLNLPNLLSPAALIQIAFLFVILYWTLRYLETTVAGGFLRSIGLLSVLGVLAAIWLFEEFELETLSAIFNYFIFFAVVSLVIIFQPELRHGLTRLGRSPLARLLRRMGVSPEQEGHTLSGEILKAARRFSRNRVGSLVVIEREVSLQPYIDRAVRLDAQVRAELLDTIFATPTLLHDGAVVVRNDRLEAAGVVLPLTQNPDIPKNYGTRHRAAIGITEESDAVVVITSEETGAISVAVNGRLVQQEDIVKTEELLDLLLAGEEVEL